MFNIVNDKFSYDDRKNELKSKFEYFKKIYNFRADNSSKLRVFLNEFDDDLFSNFEYFFTENSNFLLISAYTLAEELVKNHFKNILLSRINNNDYLSTFLEANINNYGPSHIKLDDLYKSIRKYLFNDFNFSINCNNEYFRVYDDVVSSRHEYAHTGNITKNINPIDYIPKFIFVLDYLDYEFTNLNNGIKFRTIFQNLIKKISFELSTFNNDLDKPNFYTKYGCLKSYLYELNTKYFINLKNNDICKDFFIHSYYIINDKLNDYNLSKNYITDLINDYNILDMSL